MKFLIFLGTVRDSTPPSPARLGERVAKAALACLQARFAEHEFQMIDALDFPVERIFKPHFAYRQNDVPTQLDALATSIEQADGYVMVSPEYNHSMSPALADMLNHFGSSLFSYKPSAIVTYSAGQWGGMRAAVNMRTFLSELGCLPVSAMIHIPSAQTVFTADGAMQDGENQHQWFDYFERTFAQLIWWATAARKHKVETNPHARIGGFNSSPDERNAP